MAAKETQKTVKLKLTFPEKILGEPVIHRLSNSMNVTPNILRGRITEKSAWLEVELSGGVKNVEKALKYLADQGISISEL